MSTVLVVVLVALGNGHGFFSVQPMDPLPHRVNLQFVGEWVIFSLARPGSIFFTSVFSNAPDCVD